MKDRGDAHAGAEVLGVALVREARALADANRLFNWEVAFPGVWRDLASAGRTGGFDAVIGNPPYVRQEQIAAIKPALKAGYAAFAGTADLFVYFYEQGLKLLRPGGRMAYVVTNKWLKAGYAEELRRLFAEQAWIEFLADFGHAKRFFRDADVFPSVLVARKPDRGPAPETFDLAVIPRDEVPGEGLDAAVRAAGYPARRDQLTAAPWTLEPPEVAALLAKLTGNGVPLADYAGVRPYRGILTGFNEAFLIDTATKERLIREDGRAAELLKPYLRGQDIDRWLPDWAGLWMIVMRSSNDHPWPWANAPTEAEAEAIFAEAYPSLHRNFKRFESMPDPATGKRTGLRHREDHGRFWWELRPCAYYDAFARPKICWQAIQFYPQYAIDRSGLFINNKAYVLNTEDAWLPAVLNAPAIWWFSWRHFLHMKDEALSNDAVKFVTLPVPPLATADIAQAHDAVGRLEQLTTIIRTADCSLADWLRVEQGLAKLSGALGEASRLDADGFVAAVRAALPKRQPLTPTRLKQLRDAFADVAEPARVARARVLNHERTLSTLVNRAYRLTPEDVALMWHAAPPRMPIGVPVSLASPDAAADLG